MNSLNSPRREVGITPIQPMLVPDAVEGWQFMCAVEIRKLFDLQKPAEVTLIAVDGSTQPGFVCAGCARIMPNLTTVHTDLPTYVKPETGDGEKAD